MKLIMATVPPDALQNVQQALYGLDACFMYVSSVGDLTNTIIGHYRGAAYREPRPRMRLEIIVNNDLEVPDVIDALSRATETNSQGQVSNGCVFVVPLDDWVRLPTGQSRMLSSEEDSERAPIHVTKDFVGRW